MAVRLKNWSGNYEYSTPNVHYPETIEQVQEVVKSCKKLRVLGTRHCFNSLADSDENLISLAVSTGLDKEQTQVALSDKQRLENLAEREKELQGLGIRGVPFYIINNQYGISGAQASETFVKVLKEAGQKIEVTGEACDADRTNC